MIQDIKPHQYKVAYKQKKADLDDFAILFNNNRVLVEKNAEGNTLFPRIKEILEHSHLSVGELIFLFSIDTMNFFSLLENKVEEFENYVYKDIQIFRHGNYMDFAGITASQIVRWYNNTKYCSRCGNIMVHSEKERAMKCTDCERVVYPVLSPSVIVGVTNGNKILFTKYQMSHSRYRNYALIAGYSEVGESLEDTVRREVMEEVGLKVKNIRYYKSQPWSFSDTLLIGYFCEVDGDTKCTLEVDEIAEATWFSKEDIPVNKNNPSLTGEMMEYFRTH